MRSPVAMFAVLGEHGADLAGGSRAAPSSACAKPSRTPSTTPPTARPSSRATGATTPSRGSTSKPCSPVVQGELPLVVSVDRASDIEAVLRLAKDLDLKLILAGRRRGLDGGPADRRGQGAGADQPARSTCPGSFESLGATLENAARLHKAGVTVAFLTGDAHNSRNIKQAAGNAVAYGMPWDAALAAMTSVPARIWGIADRYGTLEPGKDADVVVWDGDPLEVTTFADAVFIRGQEMPMKSRQTELRDRYKDLKTPMPPAYQKPH